MRRKRQNQRPLSGLWPDHRLAQELKAVSKILDDNPSILELVLHDLCDTGGSGQGAPGLSAEQVLRAALLKNWHQLSYAKLAFLLSDSQSFRRFGRLPYHWSPSASCLQEALAPGRSPTAARFLPSLSPLPGLSVSLPSELASAACDRVSGRKLHVSLPAGIDAMVMEK